MSFWDKVAGSPRPAPTAPAATAQRPWWEVPTPLTPQEPEPVVAPSKAQSAKHTEKCPSCGSGNFFKPSVERMPQCFECGYNPRFEQTPSGMTGVPTEGPTQPARQVASAHTGYHPEIVQGHIG